MVDRADAFPMAEGGIIGVDEAGRGPAIGPMVVAAVAIPVDATLPPGIDDSKAIPSERREELASILHADDRIAIGIEAVPPTVIDHPRTDMNTLTVQAMARAIQSVATADMNGILDAGDPDCERFCRRVTSRLSTDVTLRAYHKADERYPPVGAASIVAKVERDALVAELEEEYGRIGSGYPNDPKTREFLAGYVRANGRLPSCARASWKTCRDILAASNQARIDGFGSTAGSEGPRSVR